MRRIATTLPRSIATIPPACSTTISTAHQKRRKTQPLQKQQHRSFLTHQTRNTAIQSLFQHLESKYGNIPSLLDQGPAAETIVSQDGILHPHHLARLFRHEATALHVPNFFHRESATKVGEDLIQKSQRGGGGGKNWKVSTSRGLESSDVGTLGEHSPYNVAVAQSNQLLRSRQQHDGSEGGDDSMEMKSPIDDYFEGVQREFRMRRIRPKPSPSASSSSSSQHELDHYQLWPLDKLRLELDEAWPSGAGLAREQTQQQQQQKNSNHGSSKNNQSQISNYPRPFGGGLPRIMRGPTRWKRGFIHVDELGPLDDKRGLFSANIYLTMPDDNEKKNAGALYVWPLGVRSRWDWYKVCVFNLLIFIFCIVCNVHGLDIDVVAAPNSLFWARQSLIQTWHCLLVSLLLECNNTI